MRDDAEPAAISAAMLAAAASTRTNLAFIALYTLTFDVIFHRPCVPIETFRSAR